MIKLESVIVREEKKPAGATGIAPVLACREYIFVGISGLFLLLSWAGRVKEVIGFDPAWFTIIVCGLPIIRGAFAGLFLKWDDKAGLLVSIALIAAAATGEYFAAGEVAWIMALGELLENRTVAKTRQGIRNLAGLVPRTAWLDDGGRLVEVPAGEVKAGDVIVVKPGENIPVDGVVISGRSAVNEAALTGESMPVDKMPGSQVFTGTANLFGALKIRSVRAGEDTALAGVIRLVDQVERQKSPAVRAADRWASRLVPAVLSIALLVYLVTGDLVRAVTILVVFCPCALVLATPTAVMAAVGNAAGKGILIKSGDAIESAGRVDLVVFDKTGTLTGGKPEVTEVRGFSGASEEEVLCFAAAAEKYSEHPLAKAIVAEAYGRGLEVDDPDNFTALPGAGVRALFKGAAILVGDRKAVIEQGIVMSEEQESYRQLQEQEGKTTVFLVVGQQLIGAIAMADSVKSGVDAAVGELQRLGIREVWLLTGDNEKAAGAVAEKMGIAHYLAGQKPEDKMSVVLKLKEKGRRVAMVGDGINDAAALAAADVGMVMGAGANDLVAGAGNVVLFSDDPGRVPRLIELGKRTLKVINQGIFLSILINTGAVVLASLGFIGPVAGALVHNAGSVFVVASAGRLLFYRLK